MVPGRAHRRRRRARQTTRGRPRRSSSTAAASIVYPEGTLTRDPDLVAHARQDRRGAPRARRRASRSSRWRTGARRTSCRATASVQLLAPAQARARRSSATPSTLSEFAGKPLDPAPLARSDGRAHGRHHALCSRSCAARPPPAKRWNPPSTARRRQVALSRRADARLPARRRARRRQLGHDLRQDPRRRRRGRHDVGATPRARARDQRGQAQQRLPARHQPAARMCGDAPASPRRSRAPSRSTSRCRARSLRENLQGRAAAHPGTDAPIVLAHEGRRTAHRPAHEPGHRAGAATSTRIAHRRGIRPQPRSRDRARAADRGRDLLDEPGDRDAVALPRHATTTSARS